MTAYFLRILAASLMFAAPVQAQSADAPEGYESFEAYEVAMFEKIDALAAQIGADINKVHKLRDELRTEYTDAKRRNDTAGMAEARALQSTVIRAFLEKFGAIADG